MNRRQFSSVSGRALASLPLLPYAEVRALSLGDLSNTQASQGLKAALEKGVLVAVDLLGKADGFLGNPKVRIPLPGVLQDASGTLRTLGLGKRIDELDIAMNRAAEAAVPLAKELLIAAVKSMTVDDAKKILAGGDTSATGFFADKTRGPLTVRFLPVVTQATETVGLAKKYDRVAGKAAGMGLIPKENANLSEYVTGKTLDGLFYMIGEEEKKIRRNPIGSGSAILEKVFGAIK